MLLTKADIERIVQDSLERRGAIDRGLLDDIWRAALRRLGGSLRLGPFEGVCRPLVTAVIEAWCGLMPYLHMPDETMHPFFKPEGEEQVIGHLTRAREIAADVRRSIAEYPGMGDAAARWSAIGHMDLVAARLESNIAIVRDIASRTRDPRTASEFEKVGHMVIKTKEFRNLQKAYQEMLGIVLGKESDRLFAEQYRLVERSLEVTALMFLTDFKGHIQ